ncbi:toxin-antitoxin system YwqK family antitoxin [Polaribacter glomeratus]|uniref:Uncharacterized protein n=1 Tax=Polaribacter glomeratus TaxID=102 RepID=A0A2S7WIW4_9FLAO|nr:toxin-antitoxin system YwqK family antitoxin [Polaribacter glomeratus]PQJ77549.1 hypothetical protein BTO16_17190 [Polaribacter glomeratus]TXD66143.1 toxin-antitoxin system YwqK family antitoxin [Polaribacter glomeratus]
MKNLITLLFLSTTSLLFCQNKKIDWFNGSIDNAMAKAEKLNAILFIYVYPENSTLTKNLDDTFFTPSPEGSWEQRTNVIELHNNYMVSIKFTAKEARVELGNNYDLSKPIFLWMNSINKQPIKGEIVRNIEDVDLKNLSKTILEEQFEKTGKSHPLYEFDNIKKIIERKNCKTILCHYDIMHGIFLKIPEDKKHYMFEELSYNPGDFNSLELKWIMQQEAFLEGDQEDKIDVFYSALTFSFLKNTPNLISLTEDQRLEAFNKYANDKIIKPLGIYAQAFKQYLIEDDEGDGFLNKNITQQHKEYYENGQLKKIGNFENVNKTGEWKYYYENGQLSDIGIYKDGKETGEWKKYRQNGTLDGVGIYENGNKTGLWKSYLKSGELLYTSNYEDGINTGVQKWYRNGKIYMFVNYENGKANGEKKEYHKNGKLKEIGIYENGKKSGLWKTYYTNEQLKYIKNYENGEINGEAKWYHENGQLSAIGNYKDGKETGFWKYYYDSGELAEIGNYENGKETGEWKSYYQNGQLTYRGNYKEGKLTGLWNNYYENGKIIIVKFWNQDKLMDIRVQLDINGKPLKKGTLSNGNGTVNIYKDDGTLIRTETYIKGKKQKK